MFFGRYFPGILKSGLQAWGTAFVLFSDAFTLVLLIIFTLWLNLSNKKLSLLEKFSFCAIPFGMLLMDALVLSLKLTEQAKKLAAAGEASDNLLEFLMECTRLRQTITTYRRGYTITDRFC